MEGAGGRLVPDIEMVEGYEDMQLHAYHDDGVRGDDGDQDHDGDGDDDDDDDVSAEQPLHQRQHQRLPSDPAAPGQEVNGNHEADVGPAEVNNNNDNSSGGNNHHQDQIAAAADPPPPPPPPPPRPREPGRINIGYDVPSIQVLPEQPLPARPPPGDDAGTANDNVAMADMDRMQLTPQEYEWALGIRHSIEHPLNQQLIGVELDSLSDFMYAQMAIVFQGNIEIALQSAKTLQKIKREYDIREEKQQAIQSVSDLLDYMPGRFMVYDYDNDANNYILGLDHVKFTMSNIKTPADYQKWLVGEYYVSHALCPDLTTVRSGIELIFETEGYKLLNNGETMDITNYRKLLDIDTSYPYHFPHVKFFHTGMFMNIFLSTIRKFLPERIHSKWNIGCTYPGGRLSNFFMIPNEEIATQRIKQQLTNAIERRYANEAVFRL